MSYFNDDYENGSDHEQEEDEDIGEDVGEDVYSKVNPTKIAFQKTPTKTALDSDSESETEIEDDDTEINQYGGVADDDEDIGKEEEEEEEDDDDEDEEDDLETDTIIKPVKPLPNNLSNIIEDDDDDDDGEVYLNKFDKDIQKNYIMNFHPECVTHNYDEIELLTIVARDSSNVIIDGLHKTLPYLTKYERTRVLGQRAKQINAGATPFVKVPENVIDGYLIAELELKQKRIPFIIRRPLPNGGSEYWNVKELDNIDF